MADLCYQCTETMIGICGQKNDLKGLSTKEDSKKQLYPVVICEGCGAIQVDYEGKCISTDCLEKHNKKEKHDNSN